MSNAIDRIKISGFRRLADIDLEMRPFMVMIGANGAGKTSFLDALSLLSASAVGNLNSKLTQLGGITNILTRGKADCLSYSISVKTPENEKLVYDFQISPNGSSGYIISKESLKKESISKNSPVMYIDSVCEKISYYNEKDSSTITPDWVHNPLETSLSQAPKSLHLHYQLRHILSGAIKYHELDVSTRAPVRLPQEMRPANLPGVNGEDLIPYLYYLRESEPDVFNSLIYTIKPVFPDFDSIGFPPVAAGMLSMIWNDKNINKPIYIHELSEGTLRYLWLISLLYSPNLSAITMIDEPEVSLHPELLSMLVDVMRETSMRTHLIVATHSESLIKFLEPEEIVVIDKDEDGNVSATWADTMDLDAWLDEYSMNEVWQMGRLGGRAI